MSKAAEKVRCRLADAADPARAPQMQSYMRSTMPFRGVAAAPVRHITREVFDEHRFADRSAWCSAVLDLWDSAEYREERYAAIALTGHRYYRGFQDESTLDLYLHLVTTGAWWDYVDVISSNRVGPILHANFDSVARTVRLWAVAEAMWVRRTAILCQLKSKADTDLALMRYTIEQNVEGSRFGTDFFIRKAIGWALREHVKTDESWVVDFVDEHRRTLSGLSRREALKNVATR